MLLTILFMGPVAVATPLVLDVPVEYSAARPLAVARAELALRHHWLTAYEDVQLLRDEDRVMIHPARDGAVATYAGAGGVIHLEYDSEDTVQAVLEALVAAHAAADNPGRFEVVAVEDTWVIRPATVQDAAGAWVPAARPLDTRITLKCDGVDACTQSIIEALTAAGFPMGHDFAVYYDESPCAISAVDEPARDVLYRVSRCSSLREPDRGLHLRWSLYAGAMGGWMLNRALVQRDIWACGFDPPGATGEGAELDPVTGRTVWKPLPNPLCDRAVGDQDRWPSDVRK